MISIIIPLYNKQKQIQKTLESVFFQTYKDFEVIIVNDGSTDNSVERVKEFLEIRKLEGFYEKVRIITQENGGVSKARNTGIENARGEYIAFLDADDEWKPEYLQTQKDLIDKYPAASVFATNYELKDFQGITSPITIKNLNFKNSDGYLNNYFQVAANSHPPLWTSAIVIKKKAIKDVGGFPVGIKSGEDLLTWAKLAVRYKIAYSKSCEAVYCLSQNYGTKSIPVKIPRGNAVGIRLEELLKICDGNKQDLKKYIGRWYKIRSNLFLRGGNKKNALFNILRTIKFKPNEYKIYVFLILLLFPKKSINKIFQKIGG